jgi:putative transcriptional regulator
MSTRPHPAPARRGTRVKGALPALTALVVLLTGWGLSTAAGPEPMHALLLVARPSLQDPAFADSVVLVLNNLGPEPVGVIVNRPTQLPVAKLFPQLKTLAALPDRLYFGGPVDLDAVWFLVRTATPPQHATQACPGLYISADHTLLLSLLARQHPMENLRIFLGHAGWGPGQLQNEISAGAWKLEEASAATIFEQTERAMQAQPKNGT